MKHDLQWMWILMLALTAVGACATYAEDEEVGVEAIALAARAKPQKVVVCHLGDSGADTITISENAVTSHLGHGDYLGECGGDCRTEGCDDGDLCTSDTCEADGACSHAAVSCDDGNPCTAETCVATLGCTSTPSAEPVACDDGNSCTASDACSGGVCRGEALPGCCLTAADCDDAHACTSDACVASACVNTAVTCSTADRCLVAFCEPTLGECETAPLSCDDDNPCTANTCDSATGCAVELVSGAPCDDGDPETVADECDSGVCVGVPPVCPDGQFVLEGGGCGCATGTACPQGCFNLEVSHRACGACGNVCAPDAACLSGICVTASFTPGTPPADSSPPTMVFSPTSVSFPNTAVGSESAPLAIHVLNAGTVDLVISRADIVGSDAHAFTSYLPSFPIVIQPGATLRFYAQFRASRTGSFAAQIGFQCNDPGCPKSVSLQGRGML